MIVYSFWDIFGGHPPLNLSDIRSADISSVIPDSHSLIYIGVIRLSSFSSIKAKMQLRNKALYLSLYLIWLTFYISNFIETSYFNLYIYSTVSKPIEAKITYKHVRPILNASPTAWFVVCSLYPIKASCCYSGAKYVIYPVEAVFR